MELSIELDDTDALEALSTSGWEGSGFGGSGRFGAGSHSRPSSGASTSGGRAMSTGSGFRDNSTNSWGAASSSLAGFSGGGHSHEHRCVVRVKPKPYSPADDVRVDPAGGSEGNEGGGGNLIHDALRVENRT